MRRGQMVPGSSPRRLAGSSPARKGLSARCGRERLPHSAKSMQGSGRGFPVPSPTSCCPSVLCPGRCGGPGGGPQRVLAASAARDGPAASQPPSLLPPQGCSSGSVWPGRRSKLGWGSGTRGCGLGSVTKQLVTLGKAFTAPHPPARVS